MYYDKGKLNKALKYYNRALNIYEKIKKWESLECIVTLNSIGALYDSQGKLN